MRLTPSFSPEHTDAVRGLMRRPHELLDAGNNGTFATGADGRAVSTPHTRKAGSVSVGVRATTPQAGLANGALFPALEYSHCKCDHHVPRICECECHGRTDLYVVNAIQAVTKLTLPVVGARELSRYFTYWQLGCLQPSYRVTVLIASR